MTARLWVWNGSNGPPLDPPELDPPELDPPELDPPELDEAPPSFCPFPESTPASFVVPLLVPSGGVAFSSPGAGRFAPSVVPGVPCPSLDEFVTQATRPAHVTKTAAHVAQPFVRARMRA